MKAFLTLNKLNTAERNLLKTKQITAEMPPQQWVELFSKLRNFDIEANSSRAWSVGLAIASFVFFIFGIPLTAIFIGFAMIPIGLLGLISFVVGYFYLRAYDIDDNVLAQRVLPLLNVLREEMKPNVGLKLRFDFRGFELPEKLVEQSEKRKTTIYRSIIDFYYRDNWLDIDATLADGTRLVLNVEDFVKHIKKIKYRKGKRKSKSKFRSVITSQIGMHRRKYALPEIKEKGTEGKITTQKHGRYYWMRIRKTVKYPADRSFGPFDLLNTIASAYIRATPVRGQK